MDLWIVSPDPATPIASTRKLSAQQAEAARNGTIFLARASSPVFAKSLAESLRGMVGKLHGLDQEALEKESLSRRQVLFSKGQGTVPVYEAMLFWPK